MFSRQLLILSVLSVVSSAAHPGVIFVDDDNCPGPGSGTVVDPFCSIQSAIDAAVDADEIVVAPGTYFEAIDFLGKAVTLRSSDGPDVTTIDAGGPGGLGTVVTCENGEGADTVLQGLTITGGNEFFGGGMSNVGSSPTVTNCTFTGNLIEGIRNTTSTPVLTNCVLWGNYEQILDNPPFLTTVNCSNVQGGWSGRVRTTLTPIRSLPAQATAASSGRFGVR